MPVLNFELGVIGLDRINNMFSSMEKRLQKINSQYDKILGRGKAGAGPPVNVSRINKMRDQTIAAAKAEHNVRMQQLNQEAAARKRMAQQEMQQIRAAGQARMNFAKRTFGTAARWTRSAGRFAMNSGMAALGMGGGVYAAYDAVNRQMSMETSAMGIAKQGAEKGMSASDIAKNAQRIMGRAKQIGYGKKMDPKQVLKAMGAVHAMTGDMGISIKSADFITTLNQATDASIEDTAMVYARLFMSARKMSPGASNKDLDKMVQDRVLAVAGQGMKGSIEMKESAKFVPRITEVMAGMDIRSPEQYTQEFEKLMAWMQMSNSDSTNAERLFTSLGSFSEQIKKMSFKGPKARFGGGGAGNITVNGKVIPVMDKGGARSPLDVMFDMMEAGGDDAREVMIGNMRANRLVAPWFGMYRQMRRSGKGAKEIRARMEELTGARLSPELMGEMAKAEQGTMEVSKENFKMQLQEGISDAIFKSFTKMEDGKRVLDPEIMSAISQLADLLPQLVKALSDFAATILKNPKKSALGMLTLPGAYEYVKDQTLGNNNNGGSILGGVFGGSALQTLGKGGSGVALGGVTAATIVAGSALSLGAGYGLSKVMEMAGIDVDAGAFKYSKDKSINSTLDAALGPLGAAYLNKLGLLPTVQGAVSVIGGDGLPSTNVSGDVAGTVGAKDNGSAEMKQAASTWQQAAGAWLALPGQIAAALSKAGDPTRNH